MSHRLTAPAPPHSSAARGPVVSPRHASAPHRKDWVGLLARLIIGGVLLVAGALKVGTPEASVAAVRAYQLLPFGVTRAVGYALPVVEIVLGLLLVLGLFTRVSAVIAAIVMTVFMVAIGSAWARGLSIDCGCFGGGGVIPQGETNYLPRLLEDAGFLLAALWLGVRPRSVLALEGWLFATTPLTVSPAQDDAHDDARHHAPDTKESSR